MRRPNVRAPRVFQRTASETSTSDRTAPPTSPLSDTTPAQAPAPATRESTAQDPVDPFPAKLAREHAHHRQRTLRAADRARPKLAVPRSASIDRTRSRSKLRPLDGEEGDGGDGGEGVFWADVWADGVVYEGARYEREGVKEVRLVDLIRPPRVSKNKVALRVSRESDFEIVPHVRSVIVLDDFDSAKGPEGVDFDHDAWEYVSSAGGDDEVKTVLSYAEVAARKAT